MLHTSKYPLRRSGRPEMVREVLSRTRTEGNRMADEKKSKMSRRSFLQKTGGGAAAGGGMGAAPAELTVLSNFIPLEEPAGGPNFFQFGDDVLYEILIDNNGDGVEDVTYQFRFKTTTQNPATFLYNTGPIGSLTDPNWNVRQLYSVT